MAVAQTVVATEPHYSIAEVATMWGLSVSTIRRIIDRQPGLVIIGNAGDGGTRRRTTVRIPESVLSRIHARLRKQS